MSACAARSPSRGLAFVCALTLFLSFAPVALAQESTAESLPPPTPAPVETHIPTVLAVGTTAYLAGALTHEGLGHGGACLAVGGQIQGLSLSNLGCQVDTLAQHRVVAAGGVAGNLVLGAGSALWLEVSPPRDPATFSFLWLYTAVNLFQASGYLMVGPWIPVGDWGTGGVLQGVQRPLPWQLGLSATGTAMTFATIPLLHHLGEPLLGRGQYADDRRTRRLTLLPYAAGAGLITLGSVANRAGPEYAVSAGIANVSGTLFLAYIPLFFSSEAFRPGPVRDTPPLSIPRSRAWEIAGVAVAVGAITAFGPGIGGGYPEPHPLDPSP